MKFPSWLLLTVLATIFCAAVNGKPANGQEYDLPAVKPTRAPLLTSTAAPSDTLQSQMLSTDELAAEKDASADGFPIKLPATVQHSLLAEESKPLAVTGFITKGGDIYEVENADGVDKIESRQARDDGQHICNYGVFVVYSDVPCEEITNIKTREVEETPALNESPVSAAKLTQNKPSELSESQADKNNLNRPNKNQQKQPGKRPTKPVQNRPNRPGQNRPNRPGQNRPNKFSQNQPNRPGQNRPNRPGQNHPNRPGQKRPDKPCQKRPNKHGQNQQIQNEVNRPNKRPNKNAQKPPFNNNRFQSRRAPPINQRRWEEEEYADDDDQYFQDYYRRNLGQRFIYEYDDY